VRPRVLHCVYDDLGNPWVAGGGALRAREIYRRLAAELDVTVATGRYPGAADRVIDGVRYVRLGLARPYALSRLSYAAAATRLLRRGAYDVGIFDYSLYTPLRWPADRPVGVFVGVLAGHTAARRFGRVMGGVLVRRERAVLGRARRICAVSRFIAGRIRSEIAPHADIDVIGAGVDDGLFDAARVDDDIVLFFGRFDIFQKGIDLLLQAAPAFLETHASTRLVLAGRGRDLPAIRAAVDRLPCRSQVEIIEGPSDEEKLRLFSRARLLAVPSRFEGFGMVAAEGMAAGLPVVATDVDSLPEVLQPPAGGVLVPPEDPAALAAAVSSLLDDAPRREALGRSARTAARPFRWDTIAAEHLAFVKRVASDSA
jgi:glycosyltransferase involved in cell wall biosynthesis